MEERDNKGRFVKGCKINIGKIPWNKGLTKEDPRVKKYSDKRIGQKHTEESKNKNRISHLSKITWIKGKHHSEETRKKISDSFKGGNSTSFKKGHKVPKEWRELIREARLKQRIPNKFTSIELKIKSFLDELHIPYKTHKAVMGITQPDFFIEPNICIYCDGDYWHNLPLMIERDKKINDILRFGGYKVIRLWEHNIKVMELNDLKEKLK